MRKSESVAAACGESPPRRRVLVIYNPTAGIGSARRLGQVLKFLSMMGAVVTVRRTAGRGDAEAFASEASEALFDVLAVAGGDGTINEVVNGLAGKALPLAVIPLGTANVLAAEIDVPRRPPDLARMILTGKSRAVCVGSANSRLFIMMAGAGFDAHLVARVSPRVKRLLGKLTYVLGGVHGMFRFASPPYRVTVDGVSFTAASVIIANGHYYGGRFICASEACLDDNTFEVCLFLSAGPLAVLRYGLALVRGRLARRPDFQIIRGVAISIESSRGESSGGESSGGSSDRSPDGSPGIEPVQLDGDIGCHLPLTIRPASRRLLLICGGETRLSPASPASSSPASSSDKRTSPRVLFL